VTARLSEAALDYAAAGWAVFPVQPRGKKPLTEHGLHDASTDAAAIRAWWRRWPEANVGLAIPRGLVAVDVDDPQAFHLLKAQDLVIPATVKSTTGRGCHLFYRTEAEIRNAVGVLPGVDLRGVGGYVVLPPSNHPSGAKYRWEVPLSSSGLAEAPDWVEGTGAAQSGTRARPAEEWRRIAALGVCQGERNTTLASLAGHLLRRGIDPFVVLDLLTCWNAVRCRPPLPENEVARTVDSIAGRELKRRSRA
jgi:hypothetical protein